MTADAPIAARVAPGYGTSPLDRAPQDAVEQHRRPPRRRAIDRAARTAPRPAPLGGFFSFRVDLGDDQLVRRQVRALREQPAQRAAEWSNCESESRPRISSIVARTSVVLTKRCTTPGRLHAEITSSTERCESTWSGPSCASSSSTKMTVSRQNGECESALDDAAEGEVVVRHERARRARVRRAPPAV